MRKKIAEKKLRNIFFLTICLLLGLALSGCQQESGIPVLDSEPADILGDDRTIFINYWAVWCGPCIEEMPILAEFREANLDRVEVYAVNFDGPSPEQLRADVEKLNVQIPSLLEDPGTLLGSEPPIALPTTLIVREGKIQNTLLGPQTLETLEAALQSL